MLVQLILMDAISMSAVKTEISPDKMRKTLDDRHGMTKYVNRLINPNPDPDKMTITNFDTDPDFRIESKPSLSLHISVKSKTISQ